MRTLKKITLLLSMLLFCFHLGFAQDTPPEIDVQERVQVVDSIAKFMTERYVFPDKGRARSTARSTAARTTATRSTAA